MLRNAESLPEIQKRAAGYLTVIEEQLGTDPQAGLAPQVMGSLEIGSLVTHAAEVVVDNRRTLKRNELAAKTLFGSIVPAVVQAQAAIHDIAVTQGQFTETDDSSLALAGAGLGQFGDYLQPFVLPEEAQLPGFVPPVSLGVVPRFVGMGQHRNKDAYLDSLHGFNVLGHNTEWPAFAGRFNLPALVDPQTYSLDEFSRLSAESADGFAEQVNDTWSLIRQGQKDHPSFTGEPVVVRAVGVLPVPPAKQPKGMAPYAIDFLPQLGLAPDDDPARVKRAYAVQLMIQGSQNLGANYLKFGYQRAESVHADVDGKVATLSIERGQKVSDELPDAIEDLGLTARSQGAIALFITPHVVKPEPIEQYVPIHAGGPVMMGGGEATKGRGLGAARVSAGPSSSWVKSQRREQGFVDRVAPELLGRPVIYTLQLLSFER